jgi:hypothetical protein
MAKHNFARYVKSLHVTLLESISLLNGLVSLNSDSVDECLLLGQCTIVRRYTQIVVNGAYTTMKFNYSVPKLCCKEI